MKYLILLMLSIPWWVEAAVFNVNSQADTVDVNPGDGSCVDPSGNCSLRAALMETNALAGADEIYLPRSTAYEITTAPMASGDDAHGDFDIRDSLLLSIMDPATLISELSELPVLDADGLNRVLEIDAEFFNSITVELNGLVIANGDSGADATSDDAGGGIDVGTGVSNLILENSVVTQNQSNNGAGINLNASNAEIRNSDISYNVLVSGTSNPGGTAIRNAFGTMTIIGSSIHHNTKAADVPGCKAAVRHNNTSVDLLIYSTLISHNGVAEVSGGTAQCADGVYAQNGSLFLINSTVTANAGRGVNFFDFMPNNFDLWVKHSIISDNAQGDCAFITTGIQNFGDGNGGYNIVSDSSCNLPAVTGNLENTDPQLAALESTYPGSSFFLFRRPMPTSPAIDAGNPAAPNSANPNVCDNMDQRGLTRPLDSDGNGSSICDIGAVEVDYDALFKNGFEASPMP